MKAESREVRREARLLAGDAEVGGQGEAETAADCRPLHCRHHRLAGTKEAHRLDVEVSGLRLEPLFGPGLARLQVRPGAEVLAFRAQHDGAALRIAVQGLGLGRASARINQKSKKLLGGRWISTVATCASTETEMSPAAALSLIDGVSVRARASGRIAGSYARRRAHRRFTLPSPRACVQSVVSGSESRNSRYSTSAASALAASCPLVKQGKFAAASARTASGFARV